MIAKYEYHLNGRQYLLENNSAEKVEIIPVDDFTVEFYEKETGKKNLQLVSLKVNECYLLVAEQLDDPTDPNLSYFFSNANRFVIGLEESLLTIKSFKKSNKESKIYLKQHLSLSAYVVSFFPPQSIPVEQIKKMAEEILKKNPTVNCSTIAYNDYGALLYGQKFFWASCVDHEMTPVEPYVFYRNGTFRIALSGIGIARRAELKNYSTTNYPIYINHFPTEEILI